MPPMSEHATKEVYVSSACWCPRCVQLNFVLFASVPVAYLC